jgi:small GTP-binding protein
MVDELNIKLTLLGQGGAGKTSIVNRITNSEYPERYIPTIGSSINKKNYKLEEDNYNIKVNIWDIGGQRSFNLFNPVFFSNIDAAFLVFDLSRPKESFKELKNVYLKNLKKHSEECLPFIVGNKLDLISGKEELKEIIDKLKIEELELPFVVISAKTGENVQKAFELIIYTYLKELKNIFPDKDIPDLSQKFLYKVDKTGNELNNLFMNTENIESFTIKKEPEIDITQTVLEEETEEDETYLMLRERFENLEIIKGQIINHFNENMRSLRDLIVGLKNTPISSLIERVNRTNRELDIFMEDFEVKLNTLLNFERLESEPEPISEEHVKEEVVSK